MSRKANRTLKAIHILKCLQNVVTVNLLYESRYNPLCQSNTLLSTVLQRRTQLYLSDIIWIMQIYGDTTRIAYDLLDITKVLPQYLPAHSFPQTPWTKHPNNSPSAAKSSAN